MGAVYTQLSLQERRKIETWWHAKVPVREMARVLKYSKATLYHFQPWFRISRMASTQVGHWHGKLVLRSADTVAERLRREPEQTCVDTCRVTPSSQRSQTAI